MAHEYDYKCNGCGAETSRDMLTVKRVQFTTMGAGSRIIRSRVKAWLCNRCVQKDSDWKLPRGRQPEERVFTEPVLPDPGRGIES